VDEAFDEALRRLGVTRDAVDVEVIARGRRGLFGSKDAHVRVTVVAPRGEPAADEQITVSNDRGQQTGDAEVGQADVEATPRTQTETDSGQSADPLEEDSAPDASPDTFTEPQEEQMSDTETQQQPEGGTEEESLSPEQWLELLDHDADLAADFIEGLLDLLDLPGDIEIVTEEQQAFVTVQDVGSGLLIGRRGATLDALQELVRCAIQRQTERRSHVRVDVEGYRARQLEKLRDKCRDAIAEVRETGEAVRLEPMDAYERKMMHDLVAKTGKVSSSSEGNEPRRRVVIHPADD
jgi:spoIIIJ-associated protein